jgi:hypothetical protein
MLMDLDTHALKTAVLDLLWESARLLVRLATLTLIALLAKLTHLVALSAKVQSTTLACPMILPILANSTLRRLPSARHACPIVIAILVLLKPPLPAFGAPTSILRVNHAMTAVLAKSRKPLQLPHALLPL